MATGDIRNSYIQCKWLYQIHNKGGDSMASVQKYLFDANEVAIILNCSKSRAYNVIHELNEELADKGYYVERGKVPKKFLEEKFYGLVIE